MENSFPADISGLMEISPDNLQIKFIVKLGCQYPAFGAFNAFKAPFKVPHCLRRGNSLSMIKNISDFVN